MLKHYLDQLSNLEFSERNLEIPRLIVQEKSNMAVRGMEHSAMTLQALADFFLAEFCVSV